MECEEDVDFLEGMEEDENNDVVNNGDPYKDINAFKNIVIDIL